MKLAGISAAICILGCGGAVLAPQADARPIRVDQSGGAWTCTSSSLGSSISETVGSPSEAVTANPGIGGGSGNVCTSAQASVSNDPDVLDPLFVVTNDLGLGGQSPSTLYEWPDGDQVGLYTLADVSANTGYIGDIEVQFNYTQDSPSGCFPAPTTAPQFTIGADAYQFSFSAASHLCDDASYTNDFLFDGTSLVGYLDQSGDLDPGCPPGWSGPGCTAVTSAPEPNTLALMLGGSLVAFFGLHRRARLRRAS